MARTNLHASGVVIGSRGLLITGRSGAGKSTLALALIDACRARRVFAALIADDQLWIDSYAGRLAAEAPAAIAGLVEVRGYGPAPVLFEPRAMIDGVVELVAPQQAPRYREEACERIAEVALPKLVLPEHNTVGAVPAVLAWLTIPVSA